MFVCVGGEKSSVASPRRVVNGNIDVGSKCREGHLLKSLPEALEDLAAFPSLPFTLPLPAAALVILAALNIGFI